jgi:hypothetical protein
MLRNRRLTAAGMEPVMSTHLSVRHRFIHRVALAVVATGALFSGVALSERPAAAQVVEIAPPAVRVEAIPAPPAPRYFWVGGYWGWRDGRHCWIDGRWERERPGWAYARPYWARERHNWRFAPGHWHRR